MIKLLKTKVKFVFIKDDRIVAILKDTKMKTEWITARETWESTDHEKEWFLQETWEIAEHLRKLTVTVPLSITIWHEKCIVLNNNTYTYLVMSGRSWKTSWLPHDARIIY